MAISPQPSTLPRPNLYHGQLLGPRVSFEVKGHLEVNAQNQQGSCPEVIQGHFEVTAISPQPLFSILAILKINYGCEMSLRKAMFVEIYKVGGHYIWQDYWFPNQLVLGKDPLGEVGVQMSVGE